MAVSPRGRSHSRYDADVTIAAFIPTDLGFDLCPWRVAMESDLLRHTHQLVPRVTTRVHDGVVVLQTRWLRKLDRRNSHTFSTGFVPENERGSGSRLMLSGTRSFRRGVPTGAVEHEHRMRAGSCRRDVPPSPRCSRCRSRLAGEISRRVISTAIPASRSTARKQITARHRSGITSKSTTAAGGIRHDDWAWSLPLIVLTMVSCARPRAHQRRRGPRSGSRYWIAVIARLFSAWLALCLTASAILYSCSP